MGEAVLTESQKIFSDANPSECYLHLCQSIIRKNNETPRRAELRIRSKSTKDERSSCSSNWRNWATFWRSCQSNQWKSWKFIIRRRCTGKNSIVASCLEKNWKNHSIVSINQPQCFNLLFRANQSHQFMAQRDRLVPERVWSFGLQAIFQGPHPNFWFFSAASKDCSVFNLIAVGVPLRDLRAPRIPPGKNTDQLLNNRVKNFGHEYKSGREKFASGKL